MKLLYCLIISFLIGCYWHVSAQEEIRFNYLGSENGANIGSVSCMLQDRSGYIWVGTAEGLLRYDGNAMVAYVHNENDSTTISNSKIDCMFEDSLNTIWVGTYFGLSKFNPITKNFTNYYFDKWSASMESSVVTGIMQDNKGMLWVATGTGIYITDPSNPHFSLVKSFSEDHYGWLIHGMETAQGGRVFVLMDTALLYTDDYGSSFKTAVNYNLSGKHFFSELYKDIKDGNLWFGAYGSLVAYNFNQKTFEIKKYALDSATGGYSNNLANDFCRLNDSIMLAGCLFGGGHSGGLVFLNTKRNTFRNYLPNKENPSSLSNQNVTCIMKDRQNTFWIGTNLGINSFNLRQLNFHWILSENCKAAGLHYFTFRQLCYDGGLWIGTVSSGLVEYTTYNQSFSWYHTPISESDNRHKNAIYSMYPDKNILWLGIGRGFTRFNIASHAFDTTTITVPELKGLYSNTPRGISKDSSGNYWFGTYNMGVFSYNPLTGKGVHYLGRDTILTTKYRNYIKCLSIDNKGNKWVGTYNDGFYRIDAVTGQISWNEPDDKKAMIIQRGLINDICCDASGNVFIATQGDGLVVYNMDTKLFRAVRNNKWAEDNEIKKIVEYEKGVLWLATRKGLSCWDLNKNTFRNFPEGMRLADMISVTGCASPDGTIYFGGDDELLYFNPNRLTESSPYVHPEVTSVSVMNKEYLSDITKPLFLSYRDNFVSFTFSAFDFLNEKGDQFAYYLEGFDKDWNYCGSRHFAEYTNLPGGNYILKLKVQTADGTRIECTHPLYLHVTTPYWKTWWFIFLCGLAAFALGYLFFYMQMQRKLEAERLRARLARDLHDDIGSSLSSISILSDMAVKNSTSEETQFIFNKISESSHKTMESMKDIVWTVNPENDEMESLFTRMRMYCSEVLEPQGIECDFKPSAEIENVKIPMEKRRNVYLIFKEVINNIAKYSKATNVRISIIKFENKIEMKIKDNGIGFNSAETSDKGNGMKNMNERARLLDGRLTILSKEGDGTMVTLIFPLT
jgi:ligand-binding sensor domain-containing protein/two-component sensor histidine kinase